MMFSHERHCGTRGGLGGRAVIPECIQKNSALLDPELGTSDPTRDRLFSIQPLFNLSLVSASRGQTSVVSKSANSSLLIATSVASNASLPTEVVSSAIARRTVKSATLRI
jgi:hypothetical protein